MRKILRFNGKTACQQSEGKTSGKGEKFLMTISFSFRTELLFKIIKCFVFRHSRPLYVSITSAARLKPLNGGEIIQKS